MFAVENYALSNECASNNKVLLLSSYHSIIHSERVNASNERQGEVAHGDTRSRAHLGKCRTWPPHVQVYLNSLSW